MLRKVSLTLTIFGISCTALIACQVVPPPGAPPPNPALSPIYLPGINYPVNPALEASRHISKGAQDFALELYTKISDVMYENRIQRDIMVSPFAVWSLLLLLVEGAAGDTLKQLRTSLHIEQDQQLLRQAYRDVSKFLKINTSTIEVSSLQALFTDRNTPVDREYEAVIERDYGSALIPVDFHDPNATYVIINDEVNKATRGLIPHAVLPQDLENANLFMLSSLFFKGQWKHPFNKSLTQSEPFFSEEGINIGNVQMMVQEAQFNYAGMNELEAHVLELPYGKQNRLSMLILLPRSGVPLNKVAHNLQKIGLAAVNARLAAKAAMSNEDEDVEVYLPRFSTTTDLQLSNLLAELGIVDVFDFKKANLAKMSPSFYVTQLVHTTKIIVDEEGTTAAAAASAVLANKATPPKFYLNRPFIYLIMEKSTNILLFAGHVMNPNNAKI